MEVPRFAEDYSLKKRFLFITTSFLSPAEVVTVPQNQDMLPECLGQSDRNGVSDLKCHMISGAKKDISVRERLQGSRFPKTYCPVLRWVAVSAVGYANTSAGKCRSRYIPRHPSVNIRVTFMVADMARKSQAAGPVQ